MEENTANETTENTKKRCNNTSQEEMIMLISTIVALQISRNKTAEELELIALILENVTVQIATIANLRLLNDGLSEEAPFLPFFPI